jgi:hypothetical protein
MDEPAPHDLAAFAYVLSAARERLAHIRGPFERSVVQTHQHAVFGHVQVVLDTPGILAYGEIERRHRVLGCIRRRTAVRDHFCACHEFLVKKERRPLSPPRRVLPLIEPSRVDASR